MKKIGFESKLFILILVLLQVGCALESEAPPRPAVVPHRAQWVGGVDGGVFIECHEVNQTDLYQCTIYNDATGEIEDQGNFSVLQSSVVRLDLDNAKLFTGWDGDYIFTSDGRKLAKKH